MAKTYNKTYHYKNDENEKVSVNVKETKLTSQSTGKTITMAGSGNYSGQQIRERISGAYDKDYKRKFCSKTNDFLEEDFQ